MKTPEQIRNMEFQKSTVGGFKQSDVELFLEEVASQIEILMKQKSEAERRLQEFSHRSPDAALSTAGIQSVLVSAQRVAEQITEEANAKAEGIEAEAKLKLTEANLKAQDIIAEAEKNAVLLGDTAKQEAAKIISDAEKTANDTLIEAKESVELEQKLYDRLKIEVADFRKKAATQCASIVELIGQLPDDIPFNADRARDVLSVDFNDPEAILEQAVADRMAKENAEVEAAEKAEAERIAAEEAVKAAEEKTAAPVFTEEPAAEAEAEAESGSEEPLDEQMTLEEEQSAFFEAPVIGEVEEEEAPVPDDSQNQARRSFIIEDDDEDDDDDKAPKKGNISFEEDDDDFDDDDDDDDDEPRLFFRRKKK